MEFGIEKRAVLIMKSKKKETMEGIELPNQERIRWREGKLEVLENIKSGHNQTIEDERKNKGAWNERENYSKPSSAAEISSKGKTSGLSFFKDTRDHS